MEIVTSKADDAVMAVTIRPEHRDTGHIFTLWK
jgi:hypothetical protein